MDTSACSFATLMGICTCIAIVNISVPAWVGVMLDPSTRVGTGVWNVAWAHTNQSFIDFDNKFSSYLVVPCSFDTCNIPSQALTWDEIANNPATCNTTTLVNQLWSAPNNFCNGDKFIKQPRVKSGRAFAFLTLFFALFATVAGCMSACIVSPRRIDYALYSTWLAFFSLVFIIIEYGSFLKWSWIVSLTKGSSYIPFVNVKNELIVLSIEFKIGAGMGAAFIVSTLALISSVGFVATWYSMKKKAIKQAEREKRLRLESVAYQQEQGLNKNPPSKEESMSERASSKDASGENNQDMEFELVKDDDLGSKKTKTEYDMIDIKDFLAEPPVKRAHKENLSKNFTADGNEVLDIKDILHEKPPKQKISGSYKNLSTGSIKPASPVIETQEAAAAAASKGNELAQT